MQPSATSGRRTFRCASRRNRILAPVASFVASLLLLSCGGGGDKAPTAPPAPVMVLTTVTVSLSATTIQVGQAAVANATGADQNGGAISTGAVTWSSSSPAVATISANGAISALTAGQTAITASAGSKSGQATLTVVPMPVASVTVAPVSASIIVGATQQLTVTTLDANSAALTGRLVTWSSSDTARASVSSSGLVTAVATGTTTITATSEGKSGSATITVLPIPVATVTISPPVASVAVGSTQQLSAITLDASGAILTGRTVTWSTSDATKAAVTATGLVTAVSVGTVTITAASELKTGTSAITVTVPAPVATVTVAPLSASILVGGTVALTATARDVNGNILSGRSWTWTANLSVVSGSYQANVLTATGIGPGVSTVTAMSEGKSGTATVTVIAVSPAITSITPATLTPGGPVTIVGTNFAPAGGNNAVRIGGVSATINSVSTTQITAIVPCVASGTVPVTVTSSGLSSSSVNATLAVTTRTLAVGQSVTMLDEASASCNELSVTGGRYLLSVFNTSTVPSANTPVVITGAMRTVSSDAALAEPATKTLRMARATQRGSVPETAARSADARAHAALLERNREIYVQSRSTPGVAEARQAARARAGLKSVVIPLTVGATVTMKNRGLSGSCSSSTTSTARVVSVGAHSIVLEDNASPTAGQVDAELAALGQIFESSQFAALANFGDVNAYDVLGGLDNPGRLVMFFTPTENVAAPGGGIIMGHVSTCDFNPSTVPSYAGSNFTKIFYARVPTALTGSAFTQDSKAWWYSSMPATLIHEAKHLTSYAERGARNASALEESWLEEGTAQIAREIYSRSVYPGTGWKTNTTYANSVYCDVRRGTAGCPSGQNLMGGVFDWLYNYYQGNEDKSVLSAGSVDGTIYGSAWMFARWLVDQYGGGTESTLLRSLTQEASLTGVANVTAKTGQSFATLLADWTMTLVADDYPSFTPSAGAKYTFPSWNTRDIWAGYNRDFPTIRLLFPLNVNAVTFGSFSLSGTLAGAAAGIVELSGTQTAKQLISLTGLSAGTTIRMSILRVQ